MKNNKKWIAATLSVLAIGGSVAFSNPAASFATDSQSTATTAKTGITSKIGSFFGRGGHMGGGFRGMGGMSAGVTKLLGMDEAAIRTERQAGKSLVEIAKAKGIDEQKLIDTIVAERNTQLDQAVKDGKMTADQATKVKTDMAAKVKTEVNDTKVGPGPGDRGMGRGGMSAAVTKLLGMDEAAIRTERQAGKSLVEIAKVKGIDEQKLIDTIVADQNTQLDQAVKAGKMTADQATKMKTDMAARVKTEVNDTKIGPGQGDRGMGRGGMSAAVTKLLGMDANAIRTERQAGKSLVEIAKVKGIDEQTLIDTIVADQNTKLDQAVKDGKLTADQIAKIKTDMAARVKTQVNDTTTGPEHGGPGAGGFGGGNHGDEGMGK